MFLFCNCGYIYDFARLFLVVVRVVAALSRSSTHRMSVEREESL
jgi:hypothetical protein